MPAKYTNNSSATLAASINASTTTIVLTNGFGAFFPSLAGGNYFYGTLFDSSNNLEIVKVTARSGDVLTVVRGQDGSTAQPFNAGAGFALRLVAASLNNFVELDSVQTISGNKTFSGTNTFSAANTFTHSLIINNEVSIQTRDTGGTLRSLLRLNNANNVLFVNAGNGSILFRNQADTSSLVSIDSDGNLTASGDVTANSDIRLKSDIQTISNALEIVKNLRGTAYIKDGKASIGVIAQEVQKVLPQVVLEGDSGYLSVAYGNMVAVLIEAVKELNEKVEKLERSS